ncbi:MAG: hypothetical protein JXL85_09250 [Bacilli bacterium]|nr:hypothetical protein [Bacilli bacterium]
MIKNLRLFKITGDKNNLERVLEHFIQLKCIQPVPAEHFVSQVHGLKTLPKENPWQMIVNELEETEKAAGIHIEPVDVYELKDAYEKVKTYIHTIHEDFLTLLLHKKEAIQLIKKYEDALTQIMNIATLDVSIDDIFSCQYINTRFGKIPQNSLETLKLYENKPIVFQLFKEQKNYYWCMYMTMEKNIKEVDNIFSSLFFERVYIPDFIHGTPEVAKQTLEMELELANQNLDDILQELNRSVEQQKEKLSFIKGELNLISQVYDAKKFVVSLGDKISITGFVHKTNVNHLIETFTDVKGVEVEIMPANLDKRLTPPKRIKSRCK